MASIEERASAMRWVAADSHSHHLGAAANRFESLHQLEKHQRHHGMAKTSRMEAYYDPWHRFLMLLLNFRSHGGEFLAFHAVTNRRHGFTLHQLQNPYELRLQNSKQAFVKDQITWLR